MKRTRALKTIKVVAFLAILLSAYLLYQHFSSGKSFCNFGESFNCDIVNKGEYSTVDGIYNLMVKMITGQSSYAVFPVPNALISIIVFIWIFMAARGMQEKNNFFGMKEERMVQVLKVLMVLSILYAAFLVYIEAAVLLNWCILCLTLDVFMAIMAYAIFTMEVG